MKNNSRGRGSSGAHRKWCLLQLCSNSRPSWLNEAELKHSKKTEVPSQCWAPSSFIFASCFVTYKNESPPFSLSFSEWPCGVGRREMDTPALRWRLKLRDIQQVSQSHAACQELQSSASWCPFYVVISSHPCLPLHGVPWWCGSCFLLSLVYPSWPYLQMFVQETQWGWSHPVTMEIADVRMWWASWGLRGPTQDLDSH